MVLPSLLIAFITSISGSDVFSIMNIEHDMVSGVIQWRPERAKRP